MRISLIVHGFPPHERTGVENYTRSLAAALTRAGHSIEVFAPCPAGELPSLALRREVVDGYGVTWFAAGEAPSNPEEMLNPNGVASRFGDFLDRERPDLVHFQHVVKLGTGLIAEAEKRGIPTVYTAHDYYAYCHRYTLLRPDLERCGIVGDSKACARCDTALAVLNGVKALGDYQMGALPEQLTEKVGTRLAAALKGKTKDTGFSKQDERETLKLRRKLDKRRAQDFAKLDLILAPTRFLRSRLIEGGLEGKKIKHLPYGIETEQLARVARDSPVKKRRAVTDAPLKIGYFGGFSKHKGVHVLLDAFGQLEGKAELELHGIGSDEPYVKLLRKRARAVKAKWCGPYESEELSSALEGVDVVVVPSLWVENYPIVIREAFAAGRPVITSRLGALPESVRDGVDGLLFEPGDAEELAELLKRCESEQGLLAKLAGKIKPVHNIDDQAKELGELYASVVPTQDGRLKRALPSSLIKSVARYEELLSLPSRELFTQAMSGIQELSAGLLKKSAPDKMTLFAAALARQSEAQNQLRDRRRESDWVRQTLVEEERELSALTQKIEWMSEVVDGREKAVVDLKRERGWLSESITAKKQEIDALALERDDLARARENLDEQREWLETALGAKQTEIEELKKSSKWQDETIESLSSQVTEADKKEDWYAETFANKTAELEEHERRSENLNLALASKTGELEEHALQLVDLRKQLEWIQGVVEERNAALKELELKCEWLDSVIEERDAAVQELERKGEWLDGVVSDRTAAVKELERKTGWLEGMLSEGRERTRHFELEAGALEGAREELEGEVAALKQRLSEQEQVLKEREESLAASEASLAKYSSIEFEMRAWLESSRDILSAFDVEWTRATERDGIAEESISSAVRENWGSVLLDVERLLDAERTEVAPDELQRRVEEFLGRLDSEERELFWRRNEMEFVRETAEQWFGKRLSLLAGALRNRIREWRAGSSNGGVQ